MVDKIPNTVVTPIQCASYGFRIFFWMCFGFLILNLILFFIMGDNETWNSNKELKEKIMLLEYYKQLQSQTRAQTPVQTPVRVRKPVSYNVRCSCPMGQPCRCLNTSNCRCNYCSRQQ